ncbi:MAG: hypothetical protein M9962_05225 [Oligoflexia bacterium]|nr:hypothetical protein [Oligoflexia bacterium]
MKIFIILTSVFLSLSSFAGDVVLRPAGPVLYDCRVFLLTEGGSVSKEWFFTTAEKNGSHGGDFIVFEEGNDQVGILADGQWLGVSWLKNDQVIAKSIFVISAESGTQSRAAIFYNPQNEDEQVHLSCDLNNKI